MAIDPSSLPDYSTADLLRMAKSAYATTLMGGQETQTEEGRRTQRAQLATLSAEIQRLERKLAQEQGGTSGVAFAAFH